MISLDADVGKGSPVEEGDVDARMWIRIEEVRSSMSLIRQMLKLLVPGLLMSAMPKARAGEGAEDGIEFVRRRRSNV